MKKILINENLKIGKWEETSRFLIPNDRLDVFIDFEVKPNEEVYFVAKNGDRTHKGRTSGQYFTLDATNFVEGELNIKLVIVNSFVEKKEFIIEPLIIEEVDGEVFAIPEISELNSKVSDLNAKIGLLEKRVAQLYEVDIEEEKNG